MNIINILDEHILSKESARKTTGHYPSSASCVVNGEVQGSCLRQQFYQFTFLEPSNPPEAGALWKFAMGNVIHDLVAKWLKEAGHKMETEVAFKQNIPGLRLPVSGRIDNIIEIKGKRIGIEVKSKFGRGMDEIKKNGARIEDILQVQPYMNCYGLDTFIMFYIARDSAYRLQFLAFPDKVLWEGIVERWKKLEEYLDKKEVPPRDYSVFINKEGGLQETKTVDGKTVKSDWQCRYCGFLDYCHGIKK